MGSTTWRYFIHPATGEKVSVKLADNKVTEKIQKLKDDGYVADSTYHKARVVQLGTDKSPKQIDGVRFQADYYYFSTNQMLYIINGSKSKTQSMTEAEFNDFFSPHKFVTKATTYGAKSKKGKVSPNWSHTAKRQKIEEKKPEAQELPDEETESDSEKNLSTKEYREKYPNLCSALQENMLLRSKTKRKPDDLLSSKPRLRK